MNVSIVTDCDTWLTLRDLARDGERLALSVLAEALLNGDGCVQDRAEAMRIYEALAMEGEAHAMSAMGDFHLIAGNRDAALAWHRKAAAAGDRAGRSRLVSLLTSSADDAEVAEGLGWAFSCVQYGDPDECAFIREQLAGFLGTISPEVLAASERHGRRVFH